MKGNATITGNITGQATVALADISGKATVMGLINGDAKTTKPIDGSGDRSRDAGLFHWLQVTPEAPQHLVWLSPQGIDYNIETSTGLHWKII